MLHILLMKIGSTVLLLIPYRFHIIFEPARLRIACRQVRLSVCRQARHAGRPVGRQAGRQAGWSVGRLAGQRAYAYMLLFIAPFFCCFITTLIDGCILYHRFISFKLHLSKAAIHCWYLYLKFRCCKPAQQHDSKPAYHWNYVASYLHWITFLVVGFCSSLF